MNSLRQHFALTLMVNHACNLRCTYCYTGAKFSAPMPAPIGNAAIERAMRSLAQGGKLQLGFFGGEPLLESRRIMEWMRFARIRSSETGKQTVFNLTTNGTIHSREAWAVMNEPDLELAVSFDGTVELHDRHRRDIYGRDSGQVVEALLQQLLDAGKPLTVVTVVRPDNLEDIPSALGHLRTLGVRQVQLSLDLWATWTLADGERLENLIHRLAVLWREWLPDFSLNWFDSKTAALAKLASIEPVTTCGFGDGEIAVAPSGRLYPCERLIGEDRANHPLRLPGHVLEGVDFLETSFVPFVRCSPCSRCQLVGACDTFCRCSNFIRTGDPNRPDGLLCRANKAAARATLEVLNTFDNPVNPPSLEKSYV